MDELIELVSPEQLPEESSTRFLLGGNAVTVVAEDPHWWRFPDLGVSLVQHDISAATAFVVSGHGPGGSFLETLAVLREIAQHASSGSSA